MTAVGSVLVVGGGAAGTATAILLAEAGVAVDLVEITPGPTALGSGITLQGNALRVLRQLGVWDEVAAAGYPFDGLGLRAPNAAGTLLAEIPTPAPGDRICRPRSACRGPRSPRSSRHGPPRRGRRSATARAAPSSPTTAPGWT